MWSLVGSLLVLMVLVGALGLMVGQLPGMRGVTRAAGRAVGTGLGWLIRRIFLLLLGVIATAVDLVITLALITAHLATARPWLSTDDWAAFLHRLNDRLLRLLTT